MKPMDDYLLDFGIFPFHEDLRTKWKSERLYEEWAVQYPSIFDADDLRQARNQGSQGYHFYEWLAAIVLFQTTGLLSLISKYQFDKHERKQRVVNRIFPSGLPNIDRSSLDVGATQFPDLLVYSSYYSDWFFCEVKGPGDRFSTRQKKLFSELARLTEKPIRVIRFKAIDL
jgi:hypothetical protein